MRFKEVSREFHESFMEEEYSRMFQLDCTMLHECAGFFLEKCGIGTKSLI